MSISRKEYNAILARRAAEKGQGGAAPKAKEKGVIKSPYERLNKTERRYVDQILAPLLAAGKIQAYWIQALTWRIGEDCRYTPEFAVLRPDGKMVLVEVKGFMRDDALVKFKATAAAVALWAEMLMVRWNVKEQRFETLHRTKGAEF